MKLELVSVDPFFPILEFHLAKLPAIIGRDDSVSVRINDRWVSDSHCELIAQEGLVWVRELNSEFGTLVNGSLVEGQVDVHSGDVITIGVRSLRVTYREMRRGSKRAAAVKNGDGKLKHASPRPRAMN